MTIRRKTIVGAMLAALLLADAGLARALNSQQMLMKECNADATAHGVGGKDRSAFMKTCLADRQKHQQDKMTTCNKEASAKSLKGTERKQFMSGCLSNH